MTGPFPGDGETPRPWGGQPHEQAGFGPDRYGPPSVNPYDPEPPTPPSGSRFPTAAYGGLYGDPPPVRPRRRGLLVAAVVAAVVVLVAAGGTLWFFTAGPGGTGGRVVAVGPAPSTGRPSRPDGFAGRSTSEGPPTTSGSAAYDQGSCFAEGSGSTPGKVELSPEPCPGDKAVFVINRVVRKATDCDQTADYHQHGYEVPDETANVVYCVSLVVPADNCLSLGGTAPIARATCGSGPDVVRVLSIESAPDATKACTDKPNPDVWFYQSPDSGQFACVSRPAGSSATPIPTG